MTETGDGLIPTSRQTSLFVCLRLPKIDYIGKTPRLFSRVHILSFRGSWRSSVPHRGCCRHTCLLSLLPIIAAMPLRFTCINKLLLLLVSCCLHAQLVVADEAQRLKCVGAINDLALSHPGLEAAAEKVLESLNMTFPFCDPEATLMSCEDKSIMFTTPDDLNNVQQEACTNAGGRYESFTGLQSCEYFGGMMKGKHEREFYINMGQCFAPTGCDGYTIELWLEAMAKLFEKDCTFETQEPPFQQAAAPASSPTSPPVKVTPPPSPSLEAAATTPFSSPPSNGAAASSSLTGGAIVGIAVSVLLVIGGLVFYRRRERANAGVSFELTAVSAIDDEEELRVMD